MVTGRIRVVRALVILSLYVLYVMLKVYVITVLQFVISHTKARRQRVEGLHHPIIRVFIHETPCVIIYSMENQARMCAQDLHSSMSGEFADWSTIHHITIFCDR